MEEIIDIYDENMSLIGQKSKKLAHIDEDWHKNSHVWIVGSSGEGMNKCLVQLRAACKSTFPNFWDIPVAGHFSAGDTPFEAVKREWEEEIGIPFPFNYLKEDLIYKMDKTKNGDPIKEFIFLYFVRADIDIKKLKLQEEEVAAVKWLTIDELEKFMKSKNFVPFETKYRNIVIGGLKKILQNEKYYDII